MKLHSRRKLNRATVAAIAVVSGTIADEVVNGVFTGVVLAGGEFKRMKEAGAWDGIVATVAAPDSPGIGTGGACWR